MAGDPFNARTYPRGYALRLPAKQDLFFEMHYTPTGRVEKPDVSRMGIIWSREEPEHVLETKVFNRKDLRLRPHDGHYKMRNYFMFETDALIHALAPHMHFRGKDFTLYKATNPGDARREARVDPQGLRLRLQLAADLRVRTAAAPAGRRGPVRGNALRQLALQPEQPGRGSGRAVRAA